MDVLCDFTGDVPVVIELDSVPLRAMPPTYIYECWFSYLDCLVLELPPGNLEPAVHRDSEEAVLHHRACLGKMIIMRL